MRPSQDPGRHVARLVAAVLAGLLAAGLVGSTAVAFEASYARPLCSGLSLRLGPGTSYARALTVDPSKKLVVVDAVSGGAYSSLCGGRIYSGTRWAVISKVDGVSVKALTGHARLYAAAELLRITGAVATSTQTPSTSPTAAPNSTPSPSPAASSAPVATPRATETAAASPTPQGATPTATASASPDAQLSGPLGSLDGSSLGIELVLVVLALLSTVLGVMGYLNRRRRRDQRAMADLPRARLDDIL